MPEPRRGGGDQRGARSDAERRDNDGRRAFQPPHEALRFHARVKVVCSAGLEAEPKRALGEGISRFNPRTPERTMRSVGYVSNVVLAALPRMYSPCPAKMSTGSASRALSSSLVIISKAARTYSPFSPFIRDRSSARHANANKTACPATAEPTHRQRRNFTFRAASLI